MTLYELFRYTDQEILELEYLLEQGRRFNIEDKIQESFFQFHPMLLKKEEEIPGFGEHEPWAFFHKRMAANEIIYYLIENTVEGEYNQEDEINKHIWKDKYVSFLVKNDLRNLSKNEIFELFRKEVEKLKNK